VPETLPAYVGREGGMQEQHSPEPLWPKASRPLVDEALGEWIRGARRWPAAGRPLRGQSLLFEELIRAGGRGRGREALPAT